MAEIKISRVNISQSETGESCKANYNSCSKTANIRTCPCNHLLLALKPLRVLQFIIDVLLVAYTMYIMVNKNRELTDIAAILLMVLFTTYFFILGVDIISQLGSIVLPEVVMFLCATLGLILFTTAAEGVYIHLYLHEKKNPLLVIIILCAVAAVLFLVDFIITILYWKQTCNKVAGCIVLGPSKCNLQTLYKCDEPVTKRSMFDVTTSISNYKRPSLSDLTHCHEYRKIGIGHRREYVDCPTNVPSRSYVRVCEVQTDPPQQKTVTDCESLVIAEVSEEPTQTLTTCPMCASNWQPQSIGPGCQSNNFGLCPTILHLAQTFGMCNCQQSSAISRGQPNVTMKLDNTPTTTVVIPGTNQRSRVTKIPK